jgi:hypothetical protein
MGCSYTSSKQFDEVASIEISTLYLGIERETKAQRDEVSCPRSHSLLVHGKNLNLNVSLSASQAKALIKTIAVNSSYSALSVNYGLGSLHAHGQLIGNLYYLHLISPGTNNNANP